MRAPAVAVLLVSACTVTQVMPLSFPRPKRPEGCAMDFFPDREPPYPYTPIAKARTECDPVRRQKCREQLHSEACKAGADAVMGLKESRDADSVAMFIDATFVVKGVVVPCDPICSPGFECEGGQCIPQCNPPCEAGEICNRKRMCEPKAGAPPGATPQ
jgi:hypothetical protein